MTSLMHYDKPIAILIYKQWILDKRLHKEQANGNHILHRVYPEMFVNNVSHDL